MQLLLTIASLLGLMTLVRRFFRFEPGETPVFAFASIVTTLYCFGLAGQLKAGAYVLISAGCLSFCAGIVRPRHREQLVSIVRDTGIWAYALTVLILVVKIAPGHYTFVGDDNFHWGKAALDMFNTDSLRLSTTQFPKITQGYTEGMSLFVYWFSQIFGFSPALGYICKDLLVFAPLAIMSNFTKNRYVPIALLAWIYFFLLAGLDWAHTIMFNNLLVDPILGAWCAAGMMARIGKKQFWWPQLIQYALLGAAIFLIKKSGALFAIVLLSICFVDYLRCRAGNDNRFFGLPGVSVLAGPVPALLLLVAVYGFFPVSWARYLDRHDLREPFAFTWSYEGLKTSAFSDKATDRDKCVRSAYWRSFFDEKMKPALMNSATPIAWYVAAHIAFGLCLALFGLKGTDKAQALWLYGISLAGFAIYVCGLFVLYLYAFPVFDACSLGGFRRYLATYLLTFSLLSASYLSYASGQGKRWGIAGFAVIVIICMTLAAIVPGHVWYFLFNQSYPQLAL